MGLLILYFSAFPIKISTPSPYCIQEKILLSRNPGGELFVSGATMPHKQAKAQHNTMKIIP